MAKKKNGNGKGFVVSENNSELEDNTSNAGEDHQLIPPEGYKLVRIRHEESDSEDETEDHIKPKLQTFKGQDDKVSIENWLKRFEMLSKYYKWSERKKVLMLGNYLEDDALNWYIENTDEFNYLELTEKLINRFGVQTVEPIVEFFNLKYDPKIGIKEYFEQKRRFGVLAKLTEQQMIPIMIQGLHPKMINNFIAVKPKSFAEFYQIAKTAEDNYKRNSEVINKNKFSSNFQTNRNNSSHSNNNFISNSRFRSNNNSKPNNYFKPNSSSKANYRPNNAGKSPNPCKYCENLGFKNRYHFESNCYYKNRAQNTQPKQVNITENESENIDESFQAINSINLN
jgi:hypothetical protein